MSAAPSRHPARRATLVSLIALAVLASLAACSSSTGAVTATSAWARESMSVERAGAAYLVIENTTGSADALISATSPAATTVEIHETMAGSSGMMGMQPVEKIDLPAGATVTLEPGGYHLMLIGLTAPLEVGTTIELTLDFEAAVDLTVSAEVRAN